jgi:hypothetical protein
MIPTQHKSSIPMTLSWPVGAQAISLALADAPHATEFSLWFSDSPDGPASAFQRLIRESQPYAILVARYKPPSRPGYSGAACMVERGWYEAKWELRVIPVLRSLRAVAASVLLHQGLPEVIKWLRSLSRVGWESRHQSITLVFSPADGTLTSQVTEGV